jgi:cation diffusion facilitator family transporter
MLQVPMQMQHHHEGEGSHDARGEPQGHQHFGPTDPDSVATREGARATWVSLGTLLLTAGIQLAIVGASGSVALLADTIHNFTDALTAVPLLIAFRLARRPPSRRYSYGLHRAEDLAGIAIVAMILVSAIFAGVEAVQRLIHPEPIHHVGWVFLAGVVGALGNEAVAAYRIRVGRKIGSAALVADGLHARTDGLASVAVVGSALAVMAGLERADPLIGLAITILIALTLVQAARAVGHRILDGTDEQTITLIEEVASGVPGVEHVTRAQARWTGHRLLAEIDVDVDPSAPVSDAHAIAEKVELELRSNVPRLTAVTVHVDPHEHPSHESATEREGTLCVDNLPRQGGA